jgi:hypothetical protein
MLPVCLVLHMGLGRKRNEQQTSISQRDGPVVKKKIGGADVAPGCIQDRFCLALDRRIWRMQIQRRLQRCTACAVRHLHDARFPVRSFKQGYHCVAVRRFRRHVEHVVSTMMCLCGCVCSSHLTWWRLTRVLDRREW